MTERCVAALGSVVYPLLTDPHGMSNKDGKHVRSKVSLTDHACPGLFLHGSDHPFHVSNSHLHSGTGLRLVEKKFCFFDHLITVFLQRRVPSKLKHKEESTNS